LDGPPGTGKSTVIRSLADSLLAKDQHVQMFHSPLRPDELDGIIATDLKIGIVDGQACGDIAEIGDGAERLTFDFKEALDSERVPTEAIEDLQEKLAAAYADAYESFAAALRIHDEWERYYIESMDFAKADEIAQEWARELFAGRACDTAATGRHLFFGAATPKAAFDYIQSLTAQTERRIFIKGRPGSGKSTLLKKLAAAAEQNGIDVQVYHCGFDPNSLDMLIFPELSTAMFDSTAPHEYFPDRSGDEVLDMYERAMAPGIDEKYAAELAPIKERYAAAMKLATSHLAAAEAIEAQMKSLYTEATNFAVVERLRQQLQSEVNERLAYSLTR
jgi:ATPase subunit of ABC transporter with duplicated ATPase domains